VPVLVAQAILFTLRYEGPVLLRPIINRQQDPDRTRQSERWLTPFRLYRGCL
jgi:hypothetical protein